jgi:hypothetical protein
LTLYSVNNSLDDWRVGFTIIKICLMTLEIIICAIHPFPRSFPSAIVNTSTSTSTESTPHMISDMSINIALGLPSTCNASFFFFEKDEVISKNSVCSSLFIVSCYCISFSFASRYIISISWLSQSSINKFFLCYQNIS